MRTPALTPTRTTPTTDAGGTAIAPPTFSNYYWGFKPGLWAPNLTLIPYPHPWRQTMYIKCKTHGPVIQSVYVYMYMYSFSENVPYGETISVILYQLFLHDCCCTCIYCYSCSGRDNDVARCRYSWATNTVSPDQGLHCTICIPPLDTVLNLSKLKR